MSNLKFITLFHSFSTTIIDYININITRNTKDLDAVGGQLPGAEHCEEGASLAAELDQFQNKRGSGPRSLAEILPAVLAKLGVQLVTSTKSGEADFT
jgi:hypothetical protein